MSMNRDNRLTHIDIPSEDYSSQRTPQKSLSTVAQPPHLKPPRNIPPRRLKRKNDFLAPLEHGKDRPRQPRDLAVPSISNFKKRTGPDIVTRYESPWGSFKKIYECDLAGTVQVVARKSRRNGVQSLRQFSGNKLDELLHRLLFTHHENIASAVECFVTKDGIFAISDFIPLTLEHVVACRAYPDEKQLNAILTQVGCGLRPFESCPLKVTGQVLNGLSYIVSQDLRHMSLDCSGILMNTSGVIKIGIGRNPVRRCLHSRVCSNKTTRTSRKMYFKGSK